MKFTPRYIATKKKGLLSKKIALAGKTLNCCTLCPRNCQIDRRSGDTGFCRSGLDAVISSYMPHFGEEPPLVGTHGSGTIFVSHCNLKCCFCQNWETSILGEGHTAGKGQIASIMLHLQKIGCHNINLVTPTHVIPQLLEDLEIAIEHGLTLPIVYNSSGYESLETLKILDGIIDIYMPDFKFWDSAVSDMACRAPDYPKVAKAAVIEMHRQVGDLSLDNNGLAQEGLLVRHLALPERLAGTQKIMDFLKDHVSGSTFVNIMSQYYPAGDALKVKKLSRPVSIDEFHAAVEYARQAGLNLIT